MKRYYVVNSQEDEDGSVLYAGNTINNEKNINLQGMGLRNKTINKELGVVKMYSEAEILFPVQAK